MTESEWLICDCTDNLPKQIRSQVSDRRLRLFGCACCRRIWHLLMDERSRTAVKVAERFADHLATEQELAAANAATAGSWATLFPSNAMYLAAVAAGFVTTKYVDDAWCADRDAAGAAAADRNISMEPEWKAHAGLFRDIVGNPFRPVRLPATVRDAPGVHSLAIAAYSERHDNGSLNPDRLAVLADVLEESGSSEETILRSLRGEDSCLCDACHYRGNTKPLTTFLRGRRECSAGCDNGIIWRPAERNRYRGFWALDVVLGKE